MSTQLTNNNRKRSAKRQHLIVGFADLCGSTEISAKLEPEHYADIIGNLHVIFTEVIEQFGGEIVRIDGDGVAFIFDHSTTLEDAGRRSVDAAVSLHERVNLLNEDLDTPNIKLRLHTGIHCGIVLLGPGNMEIGKRMILGETTNISRRLCDFAGPNQVIVSEAVLGPDIHFFQFGQKQTINVRGSQQVLTVFEVVGRAGTPNRYAARVKRGTSPLLGRDAELAHLHEYLSQCSAENSSTVLVSGPPGIGKTRLITEFLGEASEMGLRTHRGYCEAYLGTRPFQPIVQIVRSLLIAEHGLPFDHDIETISKIADKIAPDLAETLVRFFSLQSASGSSGTRVELSDVVTSVLTILNKSVSDNPLVIFIDDWQWVDDASRRVLQAVQKTASRSLFIILATREYDSLAAQLINAEVLQVSPLGAADIKRAISKLTNTHDPTILEKVIERSGGNPLLLEEICHAIVDGHEPLEHDDLSTWLESLVHSRFARLPEDQADLVRIASVVGNMIPAWILEKITGFSQSHPTLTKLEQEDFIYSSDVSGILRFKHGITRDAIYSLVDIDQRKAIHIQIISALHTHAAETGDEDVAALSYHYSAGGNPARAVEYAQQAGDQAMAVSSLDRAQAFYKLALEQMDIMTAADDIDMQRNILIRKYGVACVVDPSWDQVEMFKSETHKTAFSQDKKANAWAEYWLGFILYGLGEARQSLVHLKNSLRTSLVTNDTRQVMEIKATLGQAHAIACEYEPALALLDEAIDVKLENRSGLHSSPGLSYSLSCKGFVLADQGKFDEADALYDQAIEVLAGKEHEMTASVLSQRSAVCIWQGKYDDALEFATQAYKIADRVKARYLFAMSRSLIAATHWKMDGKVEHLLKLQETTAWIDSVSSQQFASLNYGALAEGFESVGNSVLSRLYAAKALRRAKKGDRLGEAQTYRALAYGAMRANRSDRAFAYLKKATQSAAQRSSSHEHTKNMVCEADLKAGLGGRAAAQ